MTSTLDRRDLAAAGVVSAALLALYLATLCPTVPPGDSGELITAAATLGVAHAPGYPLFTLLGKLATLVPLGTVAARVNALSAVCQALAAGLLVLAVRAVAGRLGPGIAAGLAFGAATRVWRYAVVAEVFALNDLFAAGLLLLLAVLWARTEHAIHAADPALLRDRALLPAIALVFGLSLTNHHTIGPALGPAIAAFVLLRERRVRTRLGVRSLTARRAGAGAALVIAGLLPYAYLPIAASARPALNYGDPVTLDRFVHLLLRRDWGTFRLGLDFPAETMLGRIDHLGLALLGIATDLTPLGAIAALAGALALARRREWALPMGLAAAGTLGFFLLVRTPAAPQTYLGIVERFYLLPILFAAWLGGIGLAALARRLPRRAAALLPAAAAGGAILLAAARYPALDQSANRFTRRLVSDVLASLEPRSLFLSAGDVTYNATSYAMLVEGERPDVRLLDQRLLTYPWYVATQRERYPDLEIPFESLTGEAAQDLLTLLDRNAPHRLAAFFWWQIEPSWRARYVTRPEGLVERIYLAAEAPDLEESERRHDAARDRIEGPAGPPPRDRSSFEALLYSLYSFGDCVLADEWAARASVLGKTPDGRNAFDRAVKRLERATARSPLDPEPERRLARLHLYSEHGDDRAAGRHLERLRDLSPPGSDERAWAETMLPAVSRKPG